VDHVVPRVRGRLAVVEHEAINACSIVAALWSAIQEGSCTSGYGDGVVVSMAAGSAGRVRSPWLVVIEKSFVGGVRSQVAAAISRSS